jgi:hypothetical protein
MNDLPTAIRALDDATAERVLSTLARHRLQPAAGAVTTLTADLARALTQSTGEVAEVAQATPGELARATLLLLADDPARPPELEALVTNPPAQRMGVDPVTLTALTTVALVVLQTYVKIEYDKKTGLRVKIERRPADKSLLGKVVGLLARLFPGS